MPYAARIVLLTALISFVLAGCEQRTQDKAQIKRVFADFETCNNSSDGPGAVAALASDTLDRYGELVKLALNGTPEQVRALGPMEMYEIVIMRFRGSRAELAKLDGPGYVDFAVSRGWWVIPAEDRSADTLEDIAFKGPNEASAMLVSDGERTQIRVRFVKEDGAWKLDEFSQAAGIDKNIRRAAREEGMSQSEFIVAELEERLGKDIPGTVWEPMK